MRGWLAKTEWAEDNWYANVLAMRSIPAGTGTMQVERVAFEPQWSSKILAETLQRQDRFDSAGIRGVWFFRRPPPQVQQRNIIGIDSRRENLIGYGGLPLFYITEANGSWDARGHPGQLRTQEERGDRQR